MSRYMVTGPQAKIWSACDSPYVLEIENVAKVLAWWKEGADLEEKSGSKVMRSAAAIAFALTLYKNNDKEDLVGVPKKLATWGRLKEGTKLTSARGAELWPHLLEGVNDGSDVKLKIGH